MKSSYKSLSILIFIALAITNASGESPDTNSQTEILLEPNIVDINVAILAASDYLPSFYPGSWEYFDHKICYDLNEIPAVYFIIFREPNSQFKSWDEVAQWLAKGNDELDKMKRQITIVQDSQDIDPNIKEKQLKELNAVKSKKQRDLFLSRDFATVITGATEESELLIRCYRGLPEVLVSMSALNKEVQIKQPEKKLEFGKLVYLSPFDIRYEVSEKTADEQMILTQTKGPQKEIPKKLHLFGPKEKRLEDVSIQKEKIGELKAQKKREVQKLSPNLQKKMAESEKLQKQDNAAKWNEYKARYMSKHAGTEKGGQEK